MNVHTLREELENLLCDYREGYTNTETAATKIENLFQMDQQAPALEKLFFVTASQLRILEKLEKVGNTIQILDGQICGVSFKK